MLVVVFAKYFVNEKKNEISKMQTLVPLNIPGRFQGTRVCTLVEPELRTGIRRCNIFVDKS